MYIQKLTLLVRTDLMPVQVIYFAWPFFHQSAIQSTDCVRNMNPHCRGGYKKIKIRVILEIPCTLRYEIMVMLPYCTLSNYTPLFLKEKESESHVIMLWENKGQGV